jgi:hypothetical protein
VRNISGLLRATTHPRPYADGGQDADTLPWGVRFFFFRSVDRCIGLALTRGQQASNANGTVPSFVPTPGAEAVRAIASVAPSCPTKSLKTRNNAQRRTTIVPAAKL